MPESLSTLRDLSSEHLLAKEGRLGFVLLRLVKQEGGFAGASQATDELRRIIAAIGQRHPGRCHQPRRDQKTAADPEEARQQSHRKPHWGQFPDHCRGQVDARVAVGLARNQHRHSNSNHREGKPLQQAGTVDQFADMRASKCAK